MLAAVACKRNAVARGLMSGAPRPCCTGRYAARETTLAREAELCRAAEKLTLFRSIRENGNDASNSRRRRPERTPFHLQAMALLTPTVAVLGRQ